MIYLDTHVVAQAVFTSSVLVTKDASIGGNYKHALW